MDSHKFSLQDALDTIASAERLMQSRGAQITSGLYLNKDMISGASEDVLREWRQMLVSEIETLERDVLLALKPEEKKGA